MTESPFPYFNSSILENTPYSNTHCIDLRHGYNNTIAIVENDAEQRFVIKTISKTTPEDYYEFLWPLTPFAHPNRLRKEFQILQLLSELQFPVPKPLFFDHDQHLYIYPFLTGEVASFKSFRSKHAHQQIQLAENLAIFLSKLHQVPIDTLIPFVVPDKTLIGPRCHFEKAEKILKYLFDGEFIDIIMVNKILSFLSHHSPLVFLSEKRLIHGDLYSGNILVSEGGDLVGVIDWSDASDIGDPIQDVVLAARWLAFDEKYENMNSTQIDVFSKYINSYSSNSNRLIQPDEAISILPFYDILWHLQVIAIEYARKNQQHLSYFRESLRIALSNPLQT